MGTFHSQITQFTAKEILRAFPGMPPSTAYGWQKGIRQPPEWLQPTIVEKIASQSSDSTRKKPAEDSLPDWFLNWILTHSPLSEGKLALRLQEITEEFPDATKALIEQEFEKHVRMWVKESAIRLNPDQSLKEDEDETPPRTPVQVRSMLDELKDDD